MQIKILVIEDDADAAEMLAEALRTEGYCVESVGTAGEAMFKVQEFHPNLCVTDIGLPDGTGFGLAKDLDLILHVPTVLVTGMKGLGNERPFGNVKAVRSVLFKPVSIGSLLEAVREALVGRKPSLPGVCEDKPSPLGVREDMPTVDRPDEKGPSKGEPIRGEPLANAVLGSRSPD